MRQSDPVRVVGDRIEIFRSVRKMVLGAAAGVVMIALSLTVLSLSDSVRARAVGWIGLVLFSGMFVLLIAISIRTLRRREPYVVIAPGGMQIGLGLGTPIEVRWDEVTGLEIRQVARQRFLEVQVRDPEAVRVRVESRVGRAVMLANPIIARFAPITIAEQPLPIRLEELIRLLQKRLPPTVDATDDGEDP
jgi:hypothetical protein